MTAANVFPIAALIAALTPAIVSAQTQCYPNNPAMPAAGTTCYDNRPSPLPPTDNGQRSSAPQSVEEQCAGLHLDLFGTCRRLKESKARHDEEIKAVSSLVQQGDCQGAVNRALQDNDFDIAAKAKAICTQRGGTPP